MSHIWNKEVYYSDTDAQGVIYHSAYIDIAEHAKDAFLSEAIPGFSFSRLMSSGLIPAVKSVSIAYKSAGYLGDQIQVETSVERIEGNSVFFFQTIKRDTVLSEIRTEAVFLDAGTLEESAIPAFMLDNLEIGC